jgi:uncharacterized protein (TIGR02996 family)
MTQDDAFLQAIRETPFDDAPRLIYADWLEEYGQADRAEFIRVQCQLAPLTDSDSRWSALMRLAESLLRGHWNEWVGPLRALVGPWRDRYGERWLGEEYHVDGLRRFHRGFVCGISLEADSFLRHAGEVRRLLPQLNWLHLWGAGGRSRALADTPELEGLSTLAFTDYYEAPLTARDAAALTASPYLHGLSMLQFGWNSLGDEGVEALTQAPWLAGVTWLDLTDNGLSDRAAQALADSPYLGSLRTLHLRKNVLTAAGISALTTSANLHRLGQLEYDPPTGNLLV